MNVGQRIKARRKELGMSVETLAKRLGVHSTTIYRYESGYIEKLDSAKLEPIADALYTTPAHLMGWATKESNPEPEPPQRRKWRMLSAGALNLPDEQLDKLYAMAHVLCPDDFPLEDEEERKDEK